MAIVFNVDDICPMCGSYNHVLLFDGEVEGLVRYTNDKRVYLQEAFPQTEADVREFIKTGYCGKCQKKNLWICQWKDKSWRSSYIQLYYAE